VWSLTGPLAPADRRLVERHPLEGERLAAEAAWPGTVLRGIRHHHERWDGSGYPGGLTGEAIPLEARILAVADAYEAMTSPRPHRPAIAADQALARIRGGAGVQFDPQLAAAFARSVAPRRSA
jgi:HD-GYP domain-containing protein (c-di-GMP phosphodiesterase class II)